MAVYTDYKRLFAELEAGTDGLCTLAALAGKNSPPDYNEIPAFLKRELPKLESEELKQAFPWD